MLNHLTTDEVLEVLVAKSVIDTETSREARVREPTQRARVLREQVQAHATRGTGYHVTAPEVLSSMRLRRKDTEEGARDVVTEDDIMQAVAEHLGIPWRRLDPLELDLHQVTGTLSRPFARRHICLAIGELDGALLVAMAEPRDLETIENIERSAGRSVKPVVASKSDILRIISEFYGFKSTILAAERHFGRDDAIANLEQLFRLKTDEELEATDQHIVAAVDFIIKHAYKQRSSDIHVEPKRHDGLVRYRIDGLLHSVYTLPKAILPAAISRIKMMARMDIAERRRPQDGRIKTMRGDREIEMRVSTMPTVFGEKIVIRIFDPEMLLKDPSELGFIGEQRDIWARFMGHQHGVVLLTGPTGSGKTTSLYSSLKVLASPDVNITTIEDPIEMVIEQFNQVAVSARMDITFSSILRTVLRQDPDIIMVGEIRDAETARHAIQAALTGHLVFSTLHTNDASSAFTRLADLGIESYLIASTVIGVGAQRLVRIVCPECTTRILLTVEQMRLLNIQLPKGQENRTLPVRIGEGCVECRGTGYRGRTGVFEVLPVTHGIREQIIAKADSVQISKIARHEGMMTLRQAALKKLAHGVTTFEEVVRVTNQAESG